MSLQELDGPNHKPEMDEKAEDSNPDEECHPANKSSMIHPVSKKRVRRLTDGMFVFWLEGLLVDKAISLGYIKKGVS